MGTMRTIVEIVDTDEGVIAQSDDGRAFLLKEQVWTALPELPQDGYVHPIEAHSEKLKEAFPRIMEMIGKDLPKVLDLINQEIHESHMRVAHGVGGDRPTGPDGMHECPDHECEFVGTVAEVVEHMKAQHPERTSS